VSNDVKHKVNNQASVHRICISGYGIGISRHTPGHIWKIKTTTSAALAFHNPGTFIDF
jgi:hypothetical protein